MKCPKCHAENRDDSKFCSQCATRLSVAGAEELSLTKTLATPVPIVKPGTLVAGKYKIVEEIGRGGMGIVYKAEDIRLQRTVALKFLPPQLADSPEIKERFLIEARAAAALSHPNICVIHEVGEEEDRPFIAMEYVEGETLQAKTKKGPLPLEEALAVTNQIAAGLGEAHHKGIVHRDIKSANIMVTPKGQAKVMDFGLAKLRGGSSLTKSQTTLGTVAYMSPEQAKGEEVDSRTDLWSLGVVLYEMLTGELPFRGDRDLSTIHSIIHEDAKPIKLRKPPVPEELQRVVGRALKKNREARYHTAEEMLKDLKAYKASLQAEASGVINLRSFLKRLRHPVVAVPTMLAVVGIVVLAVWFFNRQAKIRWAREVAIPEMEKLIEENNVWRDLIPAYRLAEKVESVIPGNPRLGGIFSKCSLNISVKTDPEGAKVFIKDYKEPAEEWSYLGESPLEKVRVPVGIFRWKLEKEGYETVLAAASTWAVDIGGHDVLVPGGFARTLDESGRLSPGMVRVQGAETSIGKLEDFFIDKYEVTNGQFMEFVAAGGYRERKYWTHAFIKDGKGMTWEEAMREFVDPSGQPGPATWIAGDFPEGQADFPVSGVSWYEAAAFAEFAGKSLPTGYHWGAARGEYTMMILVPQLGGFALLAPFSNFRGDGPVRVGSLNGITAYGAYDMAGNVREWCSNEMPAGRLIRGGAWGDNTYMFGQLSQAPPMDRSAKNGFRCALYSDPEKIPPAAFQALEAGYGEPADYAKITPVPDEVFQVYKDQFAYDRTALKARVESRETSSGGWIREKVSFEAAYGGERVIAYLFLPKNAAPPFQTVVYFPGGASEWQRSSEDIEGYYEFPMFLSFLVKSGRAALYPIYKGTFERGTNDIAAVLDFDSGSRQYAAILVQEVQDLKRSLDYLETRPDIDAEKLAYYGMSWGAFNGAIITAVEDRLKASVLVAGGFIGGLRPEANPVTYAPRVKAPTLMLNGLYDSFFPPETSSKPMFRLLGTPADHKRQIFYETDHIPPYTEYVRETLAWLDKYLGPVKR
jgi:serine/threonine protein kinase/formylglycine-generating enzyme required for sulfatase activity/dienelactone hydrolase